MPFAKDTVRLFGGPADGKELQVLSGPMFYDHRLRRGVYERVGDIATYVGIAPDVDLSEYED